MKEVYITQLMRDARNQIFNNYSSLYKQLQQTSMTFQKLIEVLTGKVVFNY